jgi:hypothetical protein
VHPLAQEFVAQRHQHFHALVEIARHPVGAADINFFLASIAEIVNPAVFQESPYDAAHLDAVAQPRTPGRSEQMPRTIRSISTPACEARYNA